MSGTLYHFMHPLAHISFLEEFNEFPGPIIPASCSWLTPSRSPTTRRGKHLGDIFLWGFMAELYTCFCPACVTKLKFCRKKGMNQLTNKLIIWVTRNHAIQMDSTRFIISILHRKPWFIQLEMQSIDLLLVPTFDTSSCFFHAKTTNVLNNKSWGNS